MSLNLYDKAEEVYQLAYENYRNSGTAIDQKHRRIEKIAQFLSDFAIEMLEELLIEKGDKDDSDSRDI